MADLTAEQRDELADRLDALAQSQSAGNPEVAEQLRQAASDLRSGNAAAAADALNRAAGNQRLSNADLATRDVADAASNAASAGADRLRDPASAGDGSGQGDGEGDGSGDGEGNGQGNGSGNGQGSGQGKGGAGGSPSGQVGGASPTGGQSSGQGGPGTPGAGELSDGNSEVSRAQVFDPESGGAGTDVKVDIEGGAGEGQTVGRGDAATTEGSAFVPLQDVLGDYLDRAATSLDELDLPPDLRTTVRDYFDHLAES